MNISSFTLLASLSIKHTVHVFQALQCKYRKIFLAKQVFLALQYNYFLALHYTYLELNSTRIYSHTVHLFLVIQFKYLSYT